LTFWRKWSGLPWELGADPRDGKAACCFKTAQAVREALGMSWPAERMDAWYESARSGAWSDLRWDWDDITRPIEKPEAGALIRFDNNDDSFGVGILPDVRTMITVRHNGRLIVGPYSAFRTQRLYCLQ